LFTKNIYGEFGTIFSIDINPTRVDNLKKYFEENKIENVIVIEMNAYNIEKQDASFDIAIFYRSIDHLANYYDALKEGYRVLKQNGRVYINILDNRVLNNRIENLDEFRNFAEELYDELQNGEGMCEQKKVDIDQLKRQLEKIGFSKLQEEKSETENGKEYCERRDNDIKKQLSIIEEKLPNKYEYYKKRYIEISERVKKEGMEIRPTVEIIGTK
jgi:ubiquinone/menaquinone biosynthesis C-methylase UbiE